MFVQLHWDLVLGITEVSKEYEAQLELTRINAWTTTLGETRSKVIGYQESVLREAFQKKNYLDREIVPIPSDTPTVETVSEHLDSECW